MAGRSGGDGASTAGAPGSAKPPAGYGTTVNATSPDGEERRPGGCLRAFVRRYSPEPKLLIDWHDSKMHSTAERAQDVGEERHISWSELFFDLIYVSAIARIGDDLRGEEDEHLSILDYVLLFLALYSLWERTTMYATRFFNDNFFQKCLLAVLMVGVTMLAVHARKGVDSRDITVFAVVRGCLSFVCSIPFLFVWAHIDKYTAYAISSMLHLWAEGAFFVAAGLAPLVYRRWLMAAGIMVLPFFFCRVMVALSWRPKITWLLNPTPPADIEHFSERLGLFTVIVLGEYVNGISLNVNEYTGGFLLAVVLGFLLAFNTKLLYFDVDVKTISQHAMRRSVYSAILWMWAHHALYCCIAMAGSGVAMICALNGDAADFPDPERARTFTSHGTGVVLMTLSVIRLCHVAPGADLPDEFGKKPYRRALIADAFQIFNGAIFIAVPYIFDSETLDNDTLVGVMAAAMALNVGLNLWVRKTLAKATELTNAREAQEEKKKEESSERGDGSDASSEEAEARPTRSMTSVQVEGAKRRASLRHGGRQHMVLADTNLASPLGPTRETRAYTHHHAPRASTLQASVHEPLIAPVAPQGDGAIPTRPGRAASRI